MRSNGKDFLKKTMLQTIRFEGNEECIFCTCAYEVGQQISVLGCHRLHYFHKTCLDGFMTFNDAYNQPSNCPLCRVTVDAATITQMVYQGLIKKGGSEQTGGGEEQSSKKLNSFEECFGENEMVPDVKLPSAREPAIEIELEDQRVPTNETGELFYRVDDQIEEGNLDAQVPRQQEVHLSPRQQPPESYRLDEPGTYRIDALHFSQSNRMAAHQEDQPED